MGPLIVAVVVVLLVAIWIQRTRSARTKWVTALDLPGTWDLDGEEDVFIEFIGTLDAGQYIESKRDSIEAGSWRIANSKLRLVPDSKPEQELELRLFETGKIGIDGADHARQIYTKRISNIVPMRTSS